MKFELEIPDDLAKEMEKYTDVDWQKVLIQSVEGCLHDFSILDKMKEFWDTKRKEE